MEPLNYLKELQRKKASPGEIGNPGPQGSARPSSFEVNPTFSAKNLPPQFAPGPLLE
jgi:hypothetical protein